MKMPVLFLVALLGYGCAAKKMAVKNADTLLTYQITKRIPLYSREKDKLAKDVDKFLNARKPDAQKILPVVDNLDISTGEQLAMQYEKLESFYQDLATNFTHLIAKYMSKLDDKQQKDFFEILDDENREILKLDREERIDQAEERTEMILGSIHSSQKQVIREYSDYFESRAKERLERRIKLHKSFRNIFAQDTSAEGKEKLLQEAFTDYRVSAMEGNKNLEILKKFLPTLTTKQKEHFRKEVKEIKDLLRYFLSIEY